MELRHIRHFIQVAESGSIRKAADILNVTQPTLSQSIKSLEADIGLTLFDRGGSGVKLNEFGRAMLPYANRILRERDKLLDEMKGKQGRGLGRLPIGVLSALSNNIHGEVSSEFIASHPHSMLETFLFTSNQGEMLDQLKHAKWDVILTLATKDFKVGKSYKVEPLARIKSSLYCAAKHPLAQRKNIGTEELLQYGWAITSTDIAESLLQEAFKRDEGVDLSIRFRSNSTNQLLQIVKSTDLICFAPEISVLPLLADGSLVRLDQDLVSFSSQLVLIYSNLAERSPAMRQYMNLCKKFVAENMTHPTV